MFICKLTQKFLEPVRICIIYSKAKHALMSSILVVWFEVLLTSLATTWRYSFKDMCLCPNTVHYLYFSGRVGLISTEYMYILIQTSNKYKKRISEPTSGCKEYWSKSHILLCFFTGKKWNWENNHTKIGMEHHNTLNRIKLFNLIESAFEPVDPVMLLTSLY